MTGRTEPLLLRPSEVAEMLGIARSRAYAMCADGSLKSVRIGRSVRVPADAVRLLIEGKESPVIPDDVSE